MPTKSDLISERTLIDGIGSKISNVSVKDFVFYIKGRKWNKQGNAEHGGASK